MTQCGTGGEVEVSIWQFDYSRTEKDYPWLRCNSTWYKAIEPATAAFNDETLPCIGRRYRTSQDVRTSGRSPSPSLPTTNARGPVRSASNSGRAAGLASNPATQIPRRLISPIAWAILVWA